MKTKIIVTGVAGFIASKLSQRLIESGFEVIGIDDLSNGLESNIPKEVKFVQHDLSKPISNTKVFQNCSALLHLAGQSSGEMSFKNPILDLNKNTSSTINLIKLAEEKKINKFIYASSMSVYGKTKSTSIKENHPLKPLSCYGISKLASENYLRIMAKKINPIVLRMFNVYGPGQNMENLNQGMVSIYLAQFLSKNKVVVKGSKNRVRDFIFIDDVVNIWFKCLTKNFTKPTILNVGTGTKTSVEQLLKLLLTFFPSSIIEIQDSTPGDQNNIFSNNELLERELNYNNYIKLKVGLKKFIDYCQNN